MVVLGRRRENEGRRIGFGKWREKVDEDEDGDEVGGERESGERVRKA